MVWYYAVSVVVRLSLRYALKGIIKRRKHINQAVNIQGYLDTVDMPWGKLFYKIDEAMELLRGEEVKSLNLGIIREYDGLAAKDVSVFITGTDFLCDGGATVSYFYGSLRPDK